MSVRFKLIVLVLFVALVPISVLSFTILGIHQRAIEFNLAGLHQAAAYYAAQRVTLRLDNLEDNLRRLATDTLPWHELSPVEQDAALWMLYRANDDIVAVLLLDANGQLVTQPAYLTEATAAEESRHLPEPASIVSAVSRNLPKLPAAQRERRYGEPFLIDRNQSPIATIVIPLVARNTNASSRLLAIGVSLRGVCSSIREANAVHLLLLDRAGRNLCTTPTVGPLAFVGDEPGQPLRPDSTMQSLHTRNGQEFLRGTAPLPCGWQVIAEQPTRKAFAASHAMKRQALLWICASVGIALISGILLARGITMPVSRLMLGVEALAKGDLERRIEFAGKDEFGRLGRAFNRMAQELAVRDAEIRTWNRNLQKRVEERTRAIELYHTRVVQAEKSAILAKLTAGVAAEVNDPLTGILGAIQFFSQRLRSDPVRTEESRLLANAEQAAQRIRELVKRVQALGQRQPRSQLRPLALQDVVGSVLDLVRTTATTECIDVVVSSEDDVPAILGNFTQLEQALLQVLNNAIAACIAVSRLAADSAKVDESGDSKVCGSRCRIGVRVERANLRFAAVAITDDGIGIPSSALESIFEPFVTLRSDSGRGLGLAIAKRIIEEHDGRIWAEANSERGTTLRLWLPLAEQHDSGLERV